MMSILITQQMYRGTSGTHVVTQNADHKTPPIICQ